MDKLEDRLRQIRNRLTEGLVERDLAVRLALMAALSGEHLLLVGPPGTAKSLVARRLRHAFEDTSYFERLLTRFSVPEELFGPLSIRGLEEDRYERKIESYLPTASIAFLDEIFKANSAILNALLTLLNEREFDNGIRRERTPLTAVVGASNELPDGEELDALFDRFLLRLHIDCVSRERFPELLKLKEPVEPDVPRDLALTKAELDDIQKRAEQVQVSGNVLALLKDLRIWCIDEKIRVSDRRWRKIVKLLKTSALTNGRKEVLVWDCWLLQHCIWSDKRHGKKVRKWYESRIGMTADQPSKIITIINAWEKNLKKDKKMRIQLMDGEGKNPCLDGKGKATPSRQVQKHKGNGPLFKAPLAKTISQGRPAGRPRREDDEEYTKQELQESHRTAARMAEDCCAETKNRVMAERSAALEPVTHKGAYADKCLEDIRDLREKMEAHQTGIKEEIASFESDIQSHLWLSEDFVETVSKSLHKTGNEARRLLKRVEALEQGYQCLPREKKVSEDEAETAAGGPDNSGREMEAIANER